MTDEGKRDANAPDARPREGATAREAERGDVADPDAPTASEENEAMSTILDSDPLLGVQDDAGDE
jgi:hypothetical protein